MSKTILLQFMLLTLAAPAVNAADQVEREFVRGLELFDTATSPADYKQSATVFESILSDGYQNGAVYYNAGNAWYRAGEFGRAIINYRKAKPFRPRDPYLTANLEQALAMAPGHLVEPPRPWWSHVLFWNEWLSYPSKLHLFFGGWLLLAVATSSAVLLRVQRIRLPVLVIALMLILLGIDCGLTNQQIYHSRRGAITGETIARKGIGETYEPAFDQPLRDGAEFEILAVANEGMWIFGHFENIGDGWVRDEFVAR